MIMQALLCVECVLAVGGAHSLQSFLPDRPGVVAVRSAGTLHNARSRWPHPVLQLRGGLAPLQDAQIDEEFERLEAELGLDAQDDDSLAVEGDAKADSAGAESRGLLDLSDDGGVLKAVMKSGWKSPLLNVGDEISVAVVGREARAGGVVFLNRTAANPLVFRYGKKEVVEGLELGVSSMKLGERAVLIVRSDYAYGHEQVWQNVPARATVEFDVEVLCWGERDLSDGKGGVLYKTLVPSTCTSRHMHTSAQSLDM